MKRTIGEVFDDVEKATTKKEKAQVLRDNASPVLISFLELCRSDVKWAYESRELPAIKGDFPPPGYAEDVLANQLRRMYLFQEGAKITDKRQDEIFIQMVEALSETEANILMALVQGKRLPIKMFTEKCVEDLFEGKI
jgi:hypothetical protein